MTLGQRIQELRKQAGLSQEALGEALGVSRQAVSKWEGDNGIPELDTLIAMSRLFGVTLGQLLGVEEPAPAEEASAPAMDEEKIEAILRRYVEESRREEPPKPVRKRWAPLAAVSVFAVLIIVLFAQIGGMKNTISNLRGQLSSLNSELSNVRSQVSGISGEIREILSEEAELLSTFDWELVNFDLESETVVVRLTATLKDYAAGSKMQFLVDWVKVDQTGGKAASDFVEGPDFTAEIALPMNYHSEVSIRVEDTDGNIREQLVDYIYSLHPDSFRLEAYNLMKPFQFSIGRSQTATAETAYVDIYSAYPELFWPETVAITAWVNGKEIFSENMTITQSEDSTDQFCAFIDGYYHKVSLTEGDEFVVMVRVTDNLGRTEEFTAGGIVEDWYLQRTEMAAPIDWE